MVLNMALISSSMHTTSLKPGAYHATKRHYFHTATLSAKKPIPTLRVLIGALVILVSSGGNGNLHVPRGTVTISLQSDGTPHAIRDIVCCQCVRKVPVIGEYRVAMPCTGPLALVIIAAP